MFEDRQACRCIGIIKEHQAGRFTVIAVPRVQLPDRSCHNLVEVFVNLSQWSVLPVSAVSSYTKSAKAEHLPSKLPERRMTCPLLSQVMVEGCTGLKGEFLFSFRQPLWTNLSIASLSRYCSRSSATFHCIEINGLKPSFYRLVVKCNASKVHLRALSDCHAW